MARLSSRERRELEELPAKLEALERDLAAVQGRLGDPTLYQSSPAEVKPLNERLTSLEAEIAAAAAVVAAAVAELRHGGPEGA